MKKLFIFLALVLINMPGHAYQILSSNEYGSGDARNQNIVVKCTTPTGQITNQTCSLRRYVKCVDGKNCAGWEQWRDLGNTRDTFSNWQDAANSCCRAKGLR